MSSGFTGVIACFSGSNWDFLRRLLQEMLDHMDDPVWFRMQDEVAGIRDHGELCIGNEPKRLNRMLKANKIVISDGDKDVR
jgi:hypothetical protein